MFLVPAVKSVGREDVPHFAGPAGENITALNYNINTSIIHYSNNKLFRELFL